MSQIKWQEVKRNLLKNMDPSLTKQLVQSIRSVLWGKLKKPNSVLQNEGNHKNKTWCQKMITM